MKKLKVATILGTRPEIIRLSRVLPRLDESFEHTLIHTGQNYDYELNGIFFDDLAIGAPDLFLGAAGDTSAETIGKIIITADRALQELQPDALLVLGDTNSALAVIPAKRRKIPIFHMEAGNRCFDVRVPEEVNRRIVDHTADINLTYSDIAREYLLSEGLPPDRIIKTGSPMAEVLEHYASKIAASEVLQQLALRSGAYFVVSAHREENIDSERQLSGLIDIINVLANKHDLPVVVSVHPRTRRRLEQVAAVFDKRVRLLKPLGFTDYIQLQRCAKAILSDSGTISEETAILNLRSINLRETHERPEAMEEAAVMMTGMDPVRVLQALQIIESQAKDGSGTIRPVTDYAPLNVASKVVRIIQGYTDYVNRVVWKRI